MSMSIRLLSHKIFKYLPFFSNNPVQLLPPSNLPLPPPLRQMNPHVSVSALNQLNIYVCWDSRHIYSMSDRSIKHTRAHTGTHTHTHLQTVTNTEFIPSRSFSGVSAVHQSLNGPVPLTVMAATWKLYWLPFSRPEETQETGCYYWLCDWNRYVEIIFWFSDNRGKVPQTTSTLHRLMVHKIW